MENNNFWKNISSLLYIFGFLTLILEIIVSIEFNNYIDTPYWALGGAVIWILFLISGTFFIVGANLKHLHTPEKFRDKSKLAD